MRKCANCYFCSTNAIFLCAVQIFWCAGKTNLSAQYKLLPPYGASFTTLWREFLPPYGVSFAALWSQFCCGV